MLQMLRIAMAPIAFLLVLGIRVSMAAQAPVESLAFKGDFPSPLLDPGALTKAGAAINVALEITNTGNQKLRVSTYRSVLPELVDGAGRRVPFDYGWNRSRPALPSDYPLLAPGHSLVITVEATVAIKGGQLDWKGSDGILGFWIVAPASTSYRFRLKYNERQATAGPFQAGSQLLSGIWTGEGVTDAVDLPL